MKTTKRFLGLILTIIMMFTIIPFSVLAADSKPELSTGGKLSDYFPDENFAKLIFAKVGGTIDYSILKKDINDFDHDYILSQDDVNKIKSAKTINFHEDNIRDGSNNIIGWYGIESIEGVSYFESLTSLTISQRNSKLDGKSLKVFPEEVTELTKLHTINFFMNEIEAIPETINNLTALKTFNIGYNRLSKLPDTLFELTGLFALTVSNNMLTSVKGIEKLTNIKTYSFAYNSIADLSGLMDGITQRQATNQVVHLAPIVVNEGATSFDYDLNDLGFVYDSYVWDSGSGLYKIDTRSNSMIAIYDNFETTLLNPLPYWPVGNPDPWSITKAMHDGATFRDRNNDSEKMYTLTFDADADAVIIRVGDAQNIDGDTNYWTSSLNFDVTFVIPIKRVEPTIEIEDEEPPLSPGKKPITIIDEEVPLTGDNSSVVFFAAFGILSVVFALTVKTVSKKVK